MYGFVYSPGMDMLFYNNSDSSYLNDERMVVEKEVFIDTETNIFYASEIRDIHRFNFPGKIRNLGSTALHACLIINNKRNRVLAFIGKVNLWDWAGAIPIILKANGNVTYVSGKDLNYREIFENQFRMQEYTVGYAIDDFSVIKDIFQIA